MDYNNNKNENWDWQREEYGDQKDSRYDISKCMWNGVPQNEEDMSYMHVELRCTNCFSFLIPAGNWISNIFAPESHTGQVSAIISPIVYPREDDPPVDFIAVHQSHGEQIFDFKDSGSEENAAKNHDSSTDFSFSPSKPKKFIDEDKNGSYSCLEKASTKEHEKDNLTNKSAEEATEIYLEKLYQKQGPHEFCCANCNSCITKVLLIRERCLEPAPTVALPDKEDLRCSNCFAFLIPAGNWIRNIFASKNPTGQATLTPTPKPLPSNPGNNAGLEELLLPHYSDKDLGYQVPREHQTIGHNVPERTEPSKHIVHHLGDNVQHGAVENSGAVSVIISPIVYPREDDPPVDFIAVHRTHGEQIFDFKVSGSEENAAKNHQDNDNIQNQDSSTDFSSSPSKPKKFIDQDENRSCSYLEKASTKEHEKDNLTNKSAEEATEIYLEKLYQKQGPHEFCCANCNSCITKVLIIHERYLEPAPTVALPDKEDLRCSNCFAFLIPAGNWILNIFASKNLTGQGNAATLTSTPKPLPGNPVNSTGLEEPLLPHYPDKDLGDQIPREPQTVGHNVPEGTDSKHIIHHLGVYVPHGAAVNSCAAGSAETEPGNSFLIPMRTADESDGVSFIVGPTSEVKELIKVLMKKIFRRLHPNKKAGRWYN